MESLVLGDADPPDPAGQGLQSGPQVGIQQGAFQSQTEISAEKHGFHGSQPRWAATVRAKPWSISSCVPCMEASSAWRQRREGTEGEEQPLHPARQGIETNRSIATKKLKTPGPQGFSLFMKPHLSTPCAPWPLAVKTPEGFRRQPNLSHPCHCCPAGAS
jgi:hypothetical protein